MKKVRIAFEIIQTIAALMSILSTLGAFIAWLHKHLS